MANKKIATVLAFEKKLAPSDGYMYGTKWEEREKEGEPIENGIPLKLIEKSVRGTISNRLKKNMQSDPTKLDNAVEKPNLQRVDSCALKAEHDTLQLQYTLKVLSGVETPSACNNSDFQKTYSAAAKKYISDEKFFELAKRYAMNIANGRALWRNRLGAEHIEVRVKALHDDDEDSWRFDAKNFSVRDFDQTGPEVDKLAAKMAAALSGERDFLLLKVDTFAKVGKAQEIYPSEELVFEKGKGEKSKILYEINGTAGMHSQKIGNALRTIDTWYPEFDDVNTGPIAVEPYGAVTNLGKAYRTPKNKADFYTLFDQWACGGALKRKEDEHYVMAVLVRGGVFGEAKE